MSENSYYQQKPFSKQKRQRTMHYNLLAKKADPLFADTTLKGGRNKIESGKLQKTLLLKTKDKTTLRFQKMVNRLNLYCLG